MAPFGLHSFKKNKQNTLAQFLLNQNWTESLWSQTWPDKPINLLSSKINFGLTVTKQTGPIFLRLQGRPHPSTSLFSLPTWLCLAPIHISFQVLSSFATSLCSLGLWASSYLKVLNKRSELSEGPALSSTVSAAVWGWSSCLTEKGQDCFIGWAWNSQTDRW